MPVKPLTFKGDKKPKKRKHADTDSAALVPHTTVSYTSQPDPSQEDENETWTTPDTPSDLSGPCLLVLPTNPPTALSSDAHGNIFASPLENMIEGHAETAEPHDVRQVWVANRVAGMGEGSVSFKGTHGGYLSCDSLGVLGARREARGVEEGFVVESAVDEDEEGRGSGKIRWRVRTAATKDKEGMLGRRYICAVTETSSAGKRDRGGGDEDEDEEKATQKRKVAVSLRGDGEAGSSTTQMILKMQARFKPRLQAEKQTKAKEKISRKELEQAVGRRLEDDEVKRLKRARREGRYHEEILDVRVKGKSDKFAS